MVTVGPSDWPADQDDLVRHQHDLASAPQPAWTPPPGRALLVAGSWVCFPRGVSGAGRAGDPAWAAAVSMQGRQGLDRHLATGVTLGPYVPGLMALRAGPLLEQAVRGLETRPDVLLVDATARDHPRRAGLALHLGAVLGVPTIGVTHRALVGQGEWPADRRGATRPLRVGDDVVAVWLRTRAGTRPVVVHPGWRVSLEDAVEIVLAAARHRTPEPLRRARHLARHARVPTR